MEGTLVGGPGEQSPPPPTEIDFKHFLCAQTASPGLIFYNDELVKIFVLPSFL